MMMKISLEQMLVDLRSIKPLNGEQRVQWTGKRTDIIHVYV